MGTPEPFESSFKQVRTNSVEHDSYAAMGWVVVEQDGTTTIMHAPRRASDRPARATAGDVVKYRALERNTCEQIAEELAESLGCPVDGGQIRWVLDEFRARVMNENRGRMVISGKLR